MSENRKMTNCINKNLKKNLPHAQHPRPNGGSSIGDDGDDDSKVLLLVLPVVVPAIPASLFTAIDVDGIHKGKVVPAATIEDDVLLKKSLRDDDDDDV